MCLSSNEYSKLHVYSDTISELKHKQHKSQEEMIVEEWLMKKVKKYEKKLEKSLYKTAKRV